MTKVPRVASWTAADEAGLAMVSRHLGHRVSRVTAVYARLQLNPVRQAVNAAAAAMMAAVEAANREQQKR